LFLGFLRGAAGLGLLVASSQRKWIIGACLRIARSLHLAERNQAKGNYE
jgi:hypothetical protein